MSATATVEEGAKLEKIPAPNGVVQAANLAIEINSAQVPELFERLNKSHSLLSDLLKRGSDDKNQSASSQGLAFGKKGHPYDRKAIRNFLNSNEHHAACIQAKVNSTVGLGYKDSRVETTKEDGGIKVDDVESKVDKALCSLCTISWQDVLTDVAEDYWQVGDGYIEVIRKDPTNPDKISGLHHIPSTDIHVVLEDANYNRHFEVAGSESAGIITRKFALFGDKEDFLKRNKFNVDPGNVSEVIQIRRPSSQNRWYGYNDWLSAVASIELMQCLKQYKYDFFLNRGVPEFMMFVLGQKLNKDDWAKIEQALRANIGLGRSHKSLALNLENPEIEIQIEKLAMEGKQDDDFSKSGEYLAQSIVTAHGVPPLLAGILVPGKLGASNELVNALQAFQLLKIGPAQRVFQQALAATLGDDTMNGGIGLAPLDFVMRKITEEIDLATMDTMSRQRTEATAKDGRDPKDGLKE